MGREVLYCVTCGARLTFLDFENKKAVRVDEMAYCAGCAPAPAPQPVPKVSRKPTAPLPRPQKPDTTETSSAPKGRTRPPTARFTPAPSPTPKVPTRTPTTRFAVVESPKKNKAVIFGAVAGGFVLLVLILVMATGSSDPSKRGGKPSPVSPSIGTKPQPPPPVDPAKLEPLRRARAFRSDHPGDLIGQVREFEKAMWELPSSHVDECKTELSGIKAALQKKLDMDLIELERKISGPLIAKDFGKALEILDGALEAYDTPMWRLGVERKIGEVLERGRESSYVPPMRSLGEGLLGWWKLDEGKGQKAADASGNGHDGTLKKGASWEKGRIGGALKFDGKDDHLEIPHAPGLNVGAKSFSVCLWVRSKNKNARRVFSKRLHDKGWHMEINSDGKGKSAPGKLRVCLNGEKMHQWILDAGIGQNKWHHVAVTVDRERNELKAYVDGAQVDKTQGLSSVNGSLDSDAPLTSAVKPIRGKPYMYFQGSLDDLRLYGRVLSPSEVEELAR